MATPQLPEYIEISKYANHLEAEQRRELWPEMVSRVFGMHHDNYGDALAPVAERVNFAQDMMLEKRALGSQRVLQFGGAPVFKHNARVYNCTVSFADRARFFQECFFLLLCGCGTGFSVQEHHVAKLPGMVKQRTMPKLYRIPDTIEGWADALGVLVSSFLDGPVPFPEYRGHRVIFDPSLVRPKGAPISSGSKAPGPEPLMLALQLAEQVMTRAMESFGRLRPIDAYDVMMHASDAVLAGGVRRSASIALFSPWDEDMATAKVGNWHATNPQRKRSNNSAVLVRDETSYADFRGLLEHTKAWGDPGFYWTDSREQVPNPCVEIGMWPVWVRPDGEHVSGWQMCNLSTINGIKCETPDDFFNACRAAATMGTLQAGYTSFPYLGEATEHIVRREALIGVSITGMMDQPDVLFDADVLERGASIVKVVNEEVADAIGINPAARATAIKPEGTSSCMLDTSSGIHPHHSRRGIRHVTANVMEAPFQHFKAANPHAVKALPSTDKHHGNTELIAFPYQVSEGALTKDDVTALDLLQRVIVVRQAWVETGTRHDLCVQPWLRHNVSNTVHVQDGEWDDVAQFIYENREHFAGVALMGAFGDKMHEQAPFVSVLTPEEQSARYGADVVSRAHQLALTLPDTFENLWAACRAAGRNVHPGNRAEATWLGGLVELADDHFSRDIDRAGIAVKDAWLWDHWTHLMENMVQVDWSQLFEAEDRVDHASDSACAGGACEVIYT